VVSKTGTEGRPNISSTASHSIRKDLTDDILQLPTMRDSPYEGHPFTDPALTGKVFNATPVGESYVYWSHMTNERSMAGNDRSQIYGNVRRFHVEGGYEIAGGGDGLDNREVMGTNRTDEN
jgi:hypothetical protein